MKKLLALMAALAMLLSCTAALADEAPADEAPEAALIALPLTVYSQTDIDRDVLAVDLAAMGYDESVLMKADAVAAVLTEADERLTLDDTGFQWDLILGGRDIFTVAGEVTDAGFTLGSNLFPSHVFSFSNEELDSLARSVSSKYKEETKAMERIDVNALARAIAPIFEKFMVNGLAAFKGGEEEKGDFSLNGNSYNTMAPVDVDLAALSSALTQFEKDLLADPTVAVTIAQFDRSGKYTKAVEKAIDPANAPALHLETYANVDDEGDQSGPVDTTFTLTMPGQKDPAARGDVLVDGEDVTAAVQFLTTDANMTMTARKTEAGHVYRGDLNVKGLYFGCVAEVGEKDEKYNDTDIYFLDPQNSLLRQSSTMTHEGERTFDLSKGTPVTLADLTAKNNKAVMTSLGMDATIGVAGITAAASEALPEEVSAMLALFSLSAKG